jgi:hypothetical protein
MRKYSKLHLENFTLEELESFSQNQLEKVSIDGLKSLLKIRESEKRESEKREDERIARFWSEEYPNLSTEDKAKYWAGGLFRSMRMQEESNHSPYAIYSENWLRETLNADPNFLELLPQIFNLWGGMFDAGKVERIIQRHLKNIRKV